MEAMTAERFVQPLEALRSPEELAKVQRYFKTAKGDTTRAMSSWAYRWQLLRAGEGVNADGRNDTQLGYPEGAVSGIRLLLLVCVVVMINCESRS